MALAPQGDQRLDLGRGTVLDVGLAQIAAVGEQAFGATQVLGQGLKLLEHRHQLSFVVCRSRDCGGHDEQAAGSHGR